MDNNSRATFTIQGYTMKPNLKLSVKYIILHYDRPILTICSADSGADQLCMLVDESSEFDKWFIIELTDNILQELIDDKISLYSAFKNNPCGKITVLTEISTGHQHIEEFRLLLTKQIADNDLPLPELYIGSYLKDYNKKG